MTRVLRAVATAAALAAASPVAAEVLLSGGPAPARVSVVSYRDIPFRTVVRQRFDFSCGSAALATLLRHHYGRDVGEEQVFRAMYASGDQAEIQRVGFSLLDMKRYLEMHGYEADGFRMTLGELAETPGPAIVMINTRGYRHFVVLKGIDDRRVLVGDPALGLTTYNHAEFGNIWNGIVFRIARPGEHFNQPSDWSFLAGARPGGTLSNASLGEMTRELPPIYQVTTRFSLDPYLR